MFRRRALLVLAVIAAVVVLSGIFLPWWGTGLVIVGMITLAVMLFPKLVSRQLGGVMRQLFDTKGRVLREAAVTVHAIELTDAPACVGSDDDDDAMEFDPDVMKFVLVDATIAPTDNAGPMTHWEPGEFRLVGFDADTSFEAMAEGEDADAGELADALLVDDDGHTEDDFEKIVGAHRVRLVFACPREMTGRGKLQYYFEGLGDLKIPA